MTSKQKDEFEKQLERNRLNSINEFLTRQELSLIKSAYAYHFDTIKSMIAAYGVKLSIENIEKIIGIHISSDFETLPLIVEINKAIQDGDLTQDMLS